MRLTVPMAYGWEGKLVRLVPLDIEKHLANATRWVNDPDVTKFLMIGDFPMTNIAEREWMEARSKATEAEAFFAVETLDGKHIGFSGIHAISWHSRTAITGTMLGEPSDWGKGYGSDAAEVRTRYAFEVLGLRVLYSSVLQGNDRSLRMLKKAGYQECGVWPKRHWKRGAFLDEILVYQELDGWLERSKSLDR